MHDVYINFLAAELARAGIKIIMSDDGFTCWADSEIINKNHDLLLTALRHGEELTDFYKKRLEWRTNNVEDSK